MPIAKKEIKFEVKTVADIPQNVKDEIVKYCYGVMRGVNHSHLKKMKIRPNLFLEVLYDVSVNNFISFEDYNISPQDLKNIYAFTKNMEYIINNFMEGRMELLAIDNNDQFYFKNTRLIEQ